MSKTAPWLAVSVDWQDSEMFDDSPMGVRLAWVCLLTFAKVNGRAGKVRFRDKAFATQYRLNGESVSDMLARAEAAGAIMRQGDVVTVSNWRAYQDPRRRPDDNDNEKKDLATNDTHFTKTPENSATRDQRPEHPSPKHQRPVTKQASEGSGVSKKRRSGDLDRAVVGSLLLYEAWIDTERKLRHGLVKSEDDVRLALALRTKALGDATITEPVGFIKATLKLKQTKPDEAWGRVSGKHEDEAKAERRSSAPSPVADLIQNIGGGAR